MKYAYYPGCSLKSTAEEYDASMRDVFSTLGVELEELPDWSCCGASSGHATDPFLANALPLRNLILAERQGDDLVAPCAACYNRLRHVDHLVRGGGREALSLNTKMQEIMGDEYRASIKVFHPLELLSRDLLEELRSRVTAPLKGLKLAAYYGCLLTRPPKEVAFEDNPEQPKSMETILTALGAETVPWTHRSKCCGASLAISRTDLVFNLVDEIVQAAQKAGADALVTACPLCHSNLDTRQTLPAAARLPVFFLSEVIGIALGSPAQKSWLRKHMVNPLPVLQGYAQAGMV